MNLSAQEITAKILTLPEQEQQEVADFVEFLKSKLARRQAKWFEAPQESQANQKFSTPQQTTGEEKEVSAIYKAFEQAGLIGCIETDEQLSTTYKEKLDFSFKHGTIE
jgi:hypothetical protein